jgi:hypothetical protein
MRSDVSITGFSIGTFITVSNPDAIPFYELPKRPIGEAIPSSTIHEFSAFSAGRPRSRRFRPRRRDFRSRENCAPVQREDRRRGTEAEAKPLHDDVRRHRILAKKSDFSAYGCLRISGYLFWRKRCKIGSVRSWKYLDVSELRGTVIHSAVGKTKAF